MTQTAERIEQRSLPILRPFTEGSAPVEIVPTNGNGKDYIYTSRSGEILHLARKRGMELPRFTWIPAEDSDRKGEFYVRLDKNQRAEVIETNHQVRIEFAGESDGDRYQVLPEVILTPQEGESIVFKIGQNKRGTQYVEIEQAGEMKATGTMDTKANVAVSETGHISLISLEGDTNVITTLGRPNTDIYPHGVEKIQARNVRNKVNGYTVDELGEFASKEMNTLPLTQLNYGRYDDFREGKESVGRPARPDFSRNSDSASQSLQPIANEPQQQKGEEPNQADSVSSEMTPEEAVRRANEKAIHTLQQIQRRRAQLESVPLLPRGVLRKQKREEKRQAELAADRAVTEHVHLQGKPLRQAIQDIYDKTLWVQHSDYDVQLAEILSLVATHSEKKRHSTLMMASVLRPAAIRFLRNSDDKDLQEMIGTLMMDAEEKNIFEMAYKRQAIGLQIIAKIGEGLAEQQKARLAAAPASRILFRRIFSR